MKLQITLVNRKSLYKGFLIVEIMISISILILFTISIFNLDASIRFLKFWSIEQLNILEKSVKELDNFILKGIKSDDLIFSKYGNHSEIIYKEPFSILKTEFNKTWGSSSCNARLEFDIDKIKYYSSGIFLGLNNNSTDIDVHNSIVYLATDSNNISQSDFFIIDTNDNNHKIISSINTGPGLSAITIAGPYAYLANTSNNSQLQILDIHNRELPILISNLKLPLPEASTTPSRAESIFFFDNYIYLGTSKWDGPEFYIISVEDKVNPRIINSFETDTLINDIFIFEDKAYLATSNNSQMRILDIKDKNNIISLQSFSPSGWQTQQGKVIDIFENELFLGRTVGGINRINNHELFNFGTSTDLNNYNSLDISGGVYGILNRNPYVYIVSHQENSEFQVWNKDLKEKIFEKDLNILASSIACDRNKIFISNQNDTGFFILELN